MNTKRLTTSVTLIAILLSCPVFASVPAYTVTAGGDRLELVPQPERGYVVRTTDIRRSGTRDAATVPLALPSCAHRIAGLGRRGVYTVENEGPAAANEKTIAELSNRGQVTYIAPLFSSKGETVAVIPEIVIRVEPGVEERQVHFLCQSLGLAVIKPMEFTTQEYLLQVSASDAEAVFAAVEQLNEADSIEWAAPNTASRPALCGRTQPGNHSPSQQVQTAASEEGNSTGVFPNDPYFPLQWHLHNTGRSGGTPGADIRAPEAWEITTGDPNIVIAVSGTGVDTHHPDLVNNLVPGYDFFDDDNTPDPINEDPLDAHDTLCAGIAAAQGNNGIGIAGVAYDCRIMPIRIGTWTSWYTEADRAMSFRWGAAHGADVFSCSWTARSAPTIRSAVRDVTQPGGMGRQGKGCVVVFAAGNEGAIFSDGPAAYPEVLAVGATDHNDVRWPYSSYGPELDIMAASGCSGDWCGTLAAFWSTDQTGPDGWSIHNSDPNILDYAQYIGGTSASCPIVAGVAVLILSIEPGLTSAEVRHFLCRSAKDLGDPGPDDYYGWGRVDARAALDMVLAKRADLNHDWRVDEDDRAILVKAMETNDLTADIAPAAKRDGVVDAKDLEMLMRYWDTQIPEVPEQGLIAHWKLDETEGSVAHNTTGDRVYNANVHGKPSWQPEAGRIGGALAFDGKDDRISAPCAVNPAESPISVFAWVKGGSPGQVVISQSGKADWLMAAAPNGGLKTALSPAGLPALTTDVVITDDQWHRIGLVWDGTQRSLYADDALVAQDSPPGLASSPGTLFIGAGNKLAKGSFWTGLIDDVRLYDRAVKP